MTHSVRRFSSNAVSRFSHTRVLLSMRPCNFTRFHTGCTCSDTLRLAQQEVCTYGVCARCVAPYPGHPLSTPSYPRTEFLLEFCLAFMQRAIDVNRLKSRAEKGSLWSPAHLGRSVIFTFIGKQSREHWPHADLSVGSL